MAFEMFYIGVNNEVAAGGFEAVTIFLSIWR
jgi:hypothetical protein